MKALLILALTTCALAPHPANAAVSVECPVVKKSITIQYPAGWLNSDARYDVEVTLKNRFGIEKVTWRTTPDPDGEFKVLESSDSVDEEKIIKILWNAYESYGYEDEFE